MSDDYLTAPGASMTEPERRYLHDLAVQAADEFDYDCTIVNIGVALGASCVCLRAGAPEAELIGVDIDPDSAHGDWEFIRADSRRFTIERLIHLLFIDGAHDYRAVKSDIQGWTPLVVQGGIVAFHDYGNSVDLPWTEGVKRAVDELMFAKGWRIEGMQGSIIAFRRV